jgi:hypothetical protein
VWSRARAASCAWRGCVRVRMHFYDEGRNCAAGRSLDLSRAYVRVCVRSRVNQARAAKGDHSTFRRGACACVHACACVRVHERVNPYRRVRVPARIQTAGGEGALIELRVCVRARVCLSSDRWWIKAPAMPPGPELRYLYVHLRVCVCARARARACVMRAPS